MKIFDNDQFEIAIATYNRPDFVKVWLEKCYDNCIARNIIIVIADSSTNEDTQELVNEWNLNHSTSVVYSHLDSDIIIGYKPIAILKRAVSKYVWISGDSRYIDFNDFDAKIVPMIQKEADYITFFPNTNKGNDGRIYTDMNQFLVDSLTSSTCIGTSIYKTDSFSALKTDSQCKKMDSLFQKNYGFAWLGYVYTLLAEENCSGGYADIVQYNILPEKKKQTWFNRFYGCWCDDLCNIVENLPESYDCKDEAIRRVWSVMHLDSYYSCFKVRATGDLNNENLQRWIRNGHLVKCTDKIDRFLEFASYPKEYFNDKTAFSVFFSERLRYQKMFSLLEAALDTSKFECQRIPKYAIYGAGALGKNLVTIMKILGIPPEYMIDRNKNIKFGNISLYSMGDNFPNVEMIVVTVNYDFDMIKKSLNKKVNAHIITIDEFIESVKTIASKSDVD